MHHDELAKRTLLRERIRSAAASGAWRVGQVLTIVSASLVIACDLIGGLRTEPVLSGTEYVESLRGQERVEFLNITGDDVVSLEPLRALRSAGTVTIRETRLRDLDGLQGLETVDSSFELFNMPELQTLTGLQGLRRAASIHVTSNAELSSVEDLRSVQQVELVDIRRNARLPQCAAKAVVAEICDAQDCSGTVSENDLFAPCDGVLPCADGVLEDVVYLGDQEDVLQLAGAGCSFVGGLIVSGTQIDSLVGLESITHAGYVNVYGNVALRSFSGLDNLAVVDNAFYIGDECLSPDCPDPTPGFLSLDGLQSLREVQGALIIGMNAELASIAALSALEQVGSLAIVNNPVLPTCEANVLVTRLLDGGVAMESVRVEGNAEPDAGPCP